MIARLSGQHVRIWQAQEGGPRLLAGQDPSWTPELPGTAGPHPTPDGPAWFGHAGGMEGLWVEVTGPEGGAVSAIAAVLELVRERDDAGRELADRYEEIDLLYAISDILGSTIQLEQAAATIVREVASVVGARRASIMVHDEQAGLLRTIASRGFDHDEAFQVDEHDPGSVAARAFRERRVLANDPELGAPIDSASGRPYRGNAWLSVPITHASPAGPLRCTGVINLTDRAGVDRFTARDRRLVSAIASQVGAALENARLAARERGRQQLHRELELAHDLQLRLLPPPTVLHGEAQVAASCRPVESVGGDFYTFSRLGKGRVGVMLGDVSSHGFGAALMMATVLSAAGIHVDAAGSPEATLRALHDSVGDELRRAEMFLTVFYGVFDRAARTLRYSSAGHGHAFRIPASGVPERLVATAPPLGLVDAEALLPRTVTWMPGTDLLCLWTDGLVDAVDCAGEHFGEDRLLEVLVRDRALPVGEILTRALAEADAWAEQPADDRTLLVLRT